MNEIADGIYDLIAGNADITGLVSTRIYRDIAPQIAARPYIVSQKASGLDIDETPSTRHNALYLVQGVSQISAAQAGLLAGYIRDTFHKKEDSLTVANWVVIWCRVEGSVELSEIDSDDGEQLWRNGRYVRIILAKST